MPEQEKTQTMSTAVTDNNQTQFVLSSGLTLQQESLAMQAERYENIAGEDSHGDQVRERESIFKYQIVKSQTSFVWKIWKIVILPIRW